MAGSNLIFYPDAMHAFSNLGMLSPDNQSYPFDARANGYARGEGLGVLILKRLPDAIRDDDIVRAVIRASGSNHNGRATVLSQPSGEAQTRLIRETYARSGLSMAHTRLVEAHGTGTAVGDPVEANALGTAFWDSRDEDAPLYM